MIALSLIDDMFDTIGASIGNAFIRADQDGDRPSGIYVTYKIINENIEDIRSNIRERSTSQADPTKTTITYKTKSDPVVSVNVIGHEEGDLDSCRDTARAILNYYKFNDITDFAVLDILTDIQDRTDYLSGGYIPRVGFDLQLSYCDTVSQDVESIESVEITPTIDDGETATEQDTFTVTKP